jgi:hypothetical protein
MVPAREPLAAFLAFFRVFLEVSAHERTMDDEGMVLRSRERQRAFDEPCAEAGSLQGGWNLGVRQNERVRAPLVGDKGKVPVFEELEPPCFAVIANVFGFTVRIHIKTTASHGPSARD